MTTEKNKKLLMFINDRCLNGIMRVRDARYDHVEDDADMAVKFKIASNRDNIKKMLKNLDQQGYLMQLESLNPYNKYWSLSQKGNEACKHICLIADASNANDPAEKLSLECGKLAKKVMDLEAQLKEKESRIERLSDENLALKSISNQTTSSYVEEAHRWASIANTIANGLNESASLKDENEALKHKVTAIQATLTETYKKLNDKTVALEKMENELARVATALNGMATWVEDIRAGK